MRLGRRQVFQLAKAYGKYGPEALVSRQRVHSRSMGRALLRSVSPAAARASRP
jgi:hypothetical protein